MTGLVFPSKTEKTQVLWIIERLLEQVVFPGVRGADRSAIQGHFANLRAKPEEMRVVCKLETFPETQTTKIELSISFEGNSSHEQPLRPLR